MELTVKNKTNFRTFRKENKKNEIISRCPHCNDVQYKGVWYAADSKLALLLNDDKDTVVNRICPACNMQIEGQYQSILYVKDVPEALLQRVVSTILTEGAREHTVNPQNRFLEFSEIIDGFRITSTSAVLVGRVSKKLKDLFDTCEVYYSYTKGEDSVPVIKVIFSTPSPLSKDNLVQYGNT